MPIEARRAAAAALLVCLQPAIARAQEAPALRLTMEGKAEKVFGMDDRCAPVDLPDVNPRAYRAADGSVVMFALHFQARALRGPGLDHLKIDCHVALASHEDADPAKYDGRRYITATWTADGRNVAALVHDEYHAETHPGRCITTDALACWWNAILAFRSTDGGANFAPADPMVLAATPFRQDVGQTRHRGFFNPSNMFGKDGFVYAFVSTTGWTGQQPGECLIRTRDPMDSSKWRAWDGRDFTVRWRDPYGPKSDAPQPACATIEPFGYAVGAVVRHRPSGNFVAVWEAPRVEGAFPSPASTTRPRAISSTGRRRRFWRRRPIRRSPAGLPATSTATAGSHPIPRCSIPMRRAAISTMRATRHTCITPASGMSAARPPANAR